MNSFFINITAELDLKNDPKTSLGTPITLGEILQKTFNINKHFFWGRTEQQVGKKWHLDGSKAAGDIPVDILKLTVGVHLTTINKNYIPPTEKWLLDLKLAAISPVFKKNNRVL